jgi:hypothetical protein
MQQRGSNPTLFAQVDFWKKIYGTAFMCIFIYIYIFFFETQKKNRPDT